MARAITLTYPVLSIEEFGAELIRTLDLDPVYVALVGARLPRDQLKRWHVAYWCFYNPGLASYMSEREGDEYWSAMRVAGANTEMSPLGGRWPREPERRHFRGAACLRALDWLCRETPEVRMDRLMDEGAHAGLALAEVVSRVKEWPLHGNWIAFKAADMLERVMGVQVRFPHDTGLMYEGPASTLELLAEMRPGLSPAEHYERLLEHFSQYRAPPTGDRYCGPQETETILCNFKSHVRGRYPVGKDIREMRHLLDPRWGETSSRLLTALNERTLELVA